MPVLGVVVTHPEPLSILAAVRASPGVASVGEPVRGRLPAVLDVPGRTDDEPLLDALRALPGVLAVDVAFADISDLHAPIDG